MEGAFVLHICTRSLPRNSRIRSKVARAERMYIPAVAYDPRYLRSSAPSARTGVSMSHACTHARACVFRCESIIVRSFDVCHRRRASKAHVFDGYFSQSSAEHANGISFDALLFAFSYYRYVLSCFYIRILRRNRESNVTICFSQLNFICTEGAKVYVKWKEMDNARERKHPSRRQCELINPGITKTIKVSRLPE